MSLLEAALVFLADQTFDRYLEQKRNLKYIYTAWLELRHKVKRGSSIKGAIEH